MKPGDIITIKEKRYQNIALVGEGTYGRVFRVSCLEDGKCYALKKIENDQSGLRCLMEADIMSRIDHPIINRAIDIDASRTHLFIVEDMANGDLDGLLKTQAMEPAELMYWSYCILDAIGTFHRHDLVHADLKPQNILLFEDSMKITDFNLSRKIFSEQTITGICCSPSFRPPEIFLHQSWNRKVDIWSLGCLFYEMRYRKQLFPDQEPGKLFETRFLTCIEEWVERHHGLRRSYTDGSVNFVKGGDFKYNDHFDNMIKSMLRYNPYERPSVEQLLIHPYFAPLNKPTFNYTILERNRFCVYDPEVVRRLFSRTFDRATLFLAVTIYKRTASITKDTDLLVQTCLYIACKVQNCCVDPNQWTSVKLLHKMEKDILAHLNFIILTDNPFTRCHGVRNNIPSTNCSSTRGCNCKMRQGGFNPFELDMKAVLNAVD